jgi:Protein of unknown function (DUF1203)
MTKTEVPHFTIRGLSPEPFRALFDLSDEELEKRRAKRYVADSERGLPCRVSLQDAEAGDEVILTNFIHLPSESPYRSTHAIFVRKAATSAASYTDSLPQMLRTRLLSIRAFGAKDMLVGADVIEGERLEEAIARFFEDPAVEFLHVHFAKPGCYACRIDRG